jgi:hypothetical protein
VQRKAIEHAGRMSAVKQRLDAARAALVEAAKHRKAMEKLRDRRQEDWKTDVDRREATATDEVAQQIGARMVRDAAIASDDEPADRQTADRTATGRSPPGRSSDSSPEDAP